MRDPERRTRAWRRPHTTTVSVTRQERDALHPELTFGLYGAAPDLGSREQAVDFRERLDLVIALHDDLGWCTDDDRRAFTVTADPDVLRRWLNDVRTAVERAVRDEHHSLQELLDGSVEYHPDERAAAVRESKALIDGDLETLHACDALLGRLPRERPRAARRLGEPMRRRRRPSELAGDPVAR